MPIKRYRSTYKPRSLRRMESKTRNRIIWTIIGVVLLGFITINWGLPALIGGLSSVNNLKPKPSAKVVEQDAAISPPVLNIPYEATNSASITIHGYATPESTVEIYLDDELKTAVKVEPGGNFLSDPISLNLGSNSIYGITLDNNQKKSLPSKSIKLLYNNEKPKLELKEPGEGIEIHGGDKKVRVSGSTDSQNSIMVNGSTVILNGDGGFFTEVNLNDGDNTIKVTATNQFNNSTTIERIVKYTP